MKGKPLGRYDYSLYSSRMTGEHDQEDRFVVIRELLRQYRGPFDLHQVPVGDEGGKAEPNTGFLCPMEIKNKLIEIMERKGHLIFVENRAVITLQNGAMEEDDKGQKSTIQ